MSCRCLSNCWQEKNPLRRVKYVIESEQFTDVNVTYAWTVKECVSMDTESCQNGQIVKERSTVHLLFRRDAESDKDFYGIFVEGKCFMIRSFGKPCEHHNIYRLHMQSY